MAWCGKDWYNSNMSQDTPIPAFGLYGEASQFPDVLHCEAFSARAPIHDWRIAPHRHGQMSQLFLIDRGRVEAKVDDHRVTLGDRTFLYVPEICVHEFVFQPDTEGSVLSFPVGVVQSIGPIPGEILPFLGRPISGPISTQLKRITQTLLDVMQAASPFRTQHVVALAHSVLAQLAETQFQLASEEKGSKSERLFQLDKLIEHHAGKAWSASDYAAALSVSTGHLSRLCRRASGLGATAYIEQRTMGEACRMLAFTQLPISEIGYRLGFSDPSYFSKRFRTARGETPSRYRSLFTN